MERQSSILQSADICSNSGRPVKGECAPDKKPFADPRQAIKDGRSKYDLMKPLRDGCAWKK